MTPANPHGRYSYGAGLWVGLVVAALIASLAMVELRCKVFGIGPCGDWAQGGYTWHFWPPFFLVLLAWAAGARWWSARRGYSLTAGLAAHGQAAAPMLGLIVAWGWFGLTGPQFHQPVCSTPALCHDVMRSSIVLWSAPWIVWGTWNIVRLWRAPSENPT